jgi:hypothetical protein
MSKDSTNIPQQTRTRAHCTVILVAALDLYIQMSINISTRFSSDLSALINMPGMEKVLVLNNSVARRTPMLYMPVVK